MPQGKKYSFFLGANTPEGFYSAFDSLTDDKMIDQVFIIKGGPGCGKSTFMKKLADKLILEGSDTEYIYCSSDTDSLDAMICPAAKTVVCDGTAPHVTEPKYPAAFETYLNFADFWDASMVKKNLKEIVALNSGIKQSYRRAYGFIRSASIVSDEMFSTVLPFCNIDKIKKRTKGIIAREIPHKNSFEGQMKKRFLSAVGKDNIFFLSDTISRNFERVYRISDTYGLSHFMLSPIAKAAFDSGYTAYVCSCPFKPGNKIDHVLIPALSLAFITTNEYLTYPDDSDRHIRLDAYLDHDEYLSSRDQLRQWKKIQQNLLLNAADAIKNSNSLHDELEKYYIPAMDFNKINRFAHDFYPKILGRLK